MRLLCPVCGELVMEIEDDGTLYEPVTPPIVIQARCRNRDAKQCKRPMLTWRIAHRGCIELIRLEPA
jgi:hypothetical protein